MPQAPCFTTPPSPRPCQQGQRGSCWAGAAAATWFILFSVASVRVGCVAAAPRAAGANDLIHHRGRRG
eukprot:12987902-Alexandrium_andersonii.AAC.1